MVQYKVDEIAQRLKTLREERGLTQENVAELIGVIDRTARRIESPKNSSVLSVLTLMSLSALYGVSTDYILWGNEHGLTLKTGSPITAPSAKHDLDFAHTLLRRSQK